MKLNATLAAVFALAFVAGCAHQNNQTAQTPPPNPDQFDKVKQPPIQAQTRFAAGQLAESQGDYGQAIALYRQALKQDPKYADALYRLGMVCTATRDFSGAIDAWTKYAALTHAASAYSDLGFCQELAGNPSAAEAAYRQGIKRDPNNETCRVNYGTMLVRHNRASEGLLQLQAVLTPAKAHYDIAAVYEQMGRRIQARIEYAKALELDPQLFDAKSKLATLQQNQ